jgi:tyrosyl-tRNA synthetase
MAIAARYYGAEAARGAADEFRRVFSEKEKPADIPRIALPAANEGEPKGLASVIVACKFATSTSQAMRLIQQGAVTWGDRKITDPKAGVNLTAAGTLMKVGKRNWAQVCAEVK